MTEDLGRVGRPGEGPELDGIATAVAEVGQVQDVIAIVGEAIALSIRNRLV